MLEVFFAIVLLVVLIVGGAFLGSYLKKEKDKNKKKSKIASIISISNVTSLAIIANTSGLAISEVKTLLEEMMAQANKNKPEYKVLKNAYIDYTKNEVILDPKASNTMLDKLGDSVHAVLDKFTPNKKEKKDWDCTYCHALNQAKTYACANCGARKAN